MATRTNPHKRQKAASRSGRPRTTEPVLPKGRTRNQGMISQQLLFHLQNKYLFVSI
jgi:hypothetical protein